MLIGLAVMFVRFLGVVIAMKDAWVWFECAGGGV